MLWVKSFFRGEFWFNSLDILWLWFDLQINFWHTVCDFDLSKKSSDDSQHCLHNSVILNDIAIKPRSVRCIYALQTFQTSTAFCYLLHCALSLAAQCIVIGPVCLWVCVFVCGSVSTITRNCVHRSSPNHRCKKCSRKK